MNDSDSFQFICSECGKSFDADPETMVETGFTMRFVDPEEAKEFIENGLAFSYEQLANMDEEELEEQGLTVEQRDAMIFGKTDSVETGGACICLSCQDSLLILDEERYPTEDPNE